MTRLGARGLLVVVVLCVGTKENAAECTVTGTEIEWAALKWDCDYLLDLHHL